MGTRAGDNRAGEAAPPRKELRGVVERITYQNPENGYTVARLAPERAAGEGEVEAALLEHPGVAEAAVTGEADPDLGERIVGWVVPREGQAPDARELIDRVAAALAPHKRPREIRFVDELPRNAMGKIQKSRLQVDAALPVHDQEALKPTGASPTAS